MHIASNDSNACSPQIEAIMVSLYFKLSSCKLDCTCGHGCDTREHLERSVRVHLHYINGHDMQVGVKQLTISGPVSMFDTIYPRNWFPVVL